MERLDEYLNLQKQSLYNERVRLEKKKNQNNISHDGENDKDINDDNKDLKDVISDQLIGNFFQNNCYEIETVKENYVSNNFATQQTISLSEVSSHNSSQDDLNSNNSGIISNDCNDSCNKKEEQKIINNASVDFAKNLKDFQSSISIKTKQMDIKNDNLENNLVCRNVNRQNNWTKLSKNDDMEQWVSDTFYSYFPSLNTEQAKRENNNRNRQLDYQNYLKKLSNTDDNQKSNEKNVNITNRYQHDSLRIGDKSEMEIIVTTNPNYDNSIKHRDNYYMTSSPRPSSTRDKLLQDLKHTELSNMIYGDGAQKRKQAEIERDMAKKKEYQKDLMRQIEDKRREIELLKEKERIDEENLTRKLEEQLRTVKLQEELEKEKIKTERTRFEIERNKIIREQLISKLENDKIQAQSPESSSREAKSENDKESLSNSIITERKRNEVYRFFTNSANRDYRKPLHHQSLTDTFEEFANNAEDKQFLLDSSKTKLFERHKSSPFLSSNCLHTKRKICPFCDIKLKNYESWCPYCKQQILDDGAENRTMLCENCENQYLICSACDKTKIICEFCHRARNICYDCTRNFCIHCGNSIRSNKNNNTKASETNLEILETSSITPSEHSFQILELPVIDNSDIPSNKKKSYSFSPQRGSNFVKNYSKNSNCTRQNINSESSYFEFGVRNGEVIINNKIYNNTNKKNLNLKSSNNIKNFEKSDKEQQSKGTFNSKSLSLNEMPLLSEIPKKSSLKNKTETRQRIFKESKSSNSSMEDLSRKWEIPAVEKRTITNHSPIILTQLGAVRRQLQIDRLQAEFL